MLAERPPRPVVWALRGLAALGVVALAVAFTLALLYVVAVLIAVEIIASMSYGGR